MQPWLLYPAFIATVVSVIGLNALAIRGYRPAKPDTLSELVVQRPSLFRAFRLILWSCVALFAITLFLFIAPRIPGSHTLLYILVGYICIAEVLSGLFPAKGKWLFWHNLFAKSMAVAMVLLSGLFAILLSGGFRQIEGLFTVFLAVLLLRANLDRKHFIHYEMPFLFVSHLSILVAAIAVR